MSFQQLVPTDAEAKGVPMRGTQWHWHIFIQWCHMETVTVVLATVLRQSERTTGLQIVWHTDIHIGFERVHVPSRFLTSSISDESQASWYPQLSLWFHRSSDVTLTIYAPPPYLMFCEMSHIELYHAIYHSQWNDTSVDFQSWKTLHVAVVVCPQLNTPHALAFYLFEILLEIRLELTQRGDILSNWLSPGVVAAPK